MISSVKRGGVVAALCVFGFLSTPLSATAEAAGPVIRISSNSGGRIGDFMMRLHQYKSQGSLVQFAGNCDSACTLLLALPRSNTCLTSGAVFRFHAPSAGSARMSLSAKRYMMAQYPGWVRSWIANNNGLTAKLISMDYSYASKFMRSCNEVASR
jgi:hypothetical protein